MQVSPANGALSASAALCGRYRHRVPRREPLVQRGRELRLDGDHAHVGPARLQRRRDPAHEPAAADGHDTTSGTGPSSRISSATVPWPAITAGVVERVHERAARLGDQLVEPLERLRSGPAASWSTAAP